MEPCGEKSCFDCPYSDCIIPDWAAQMTYEQVEKKKKYQKKYREKHREELNRKRREKYAESKRRKVNE